MHSSLTKELLTWYAKKGRMLPWRGQKDPYAIWVSEIMLQQTRVETVIPYFERWMARFPDIGSLAAASQQDVLSQWEGLGYYSRARNLHRAAQVVIEKYGGELPSALDDLRTLPGIGPYTAAAIASIAFGHDAAALDGNIRRVLARLFNVSQPLGSREAERTLEALATEHLPSGHTGNYNQALMDLGASLCKPRNPDCHHCPLKSFCQAYALDVQEQRPVRKPKGELPHHTVTAAVIQRNGHVLIAQRPEGGLLGGMWEFPGGKRKSGESLEECLKREICEELGVDIRVDAPFGTYEHAYTHFSITLHAFRCNLTSGEPQRLEHSDLRWVVPTEFVYYPMGKIDRQIADSLNN